MTKVTKNIKNNTRREILSGSIRLVSLFIGLFIFPNLRLALNYCVGLDFWVPLISTFILVVVFIFAKKIAKTLIWEDVEVNTKSMIRRFWISCSVGIIVFMTQYMLTYSQREGFYERTRYPASFLTLHAILMGIITTLAIFVIWYFVLYIIALSKYLREKT